MTELHLGHPRPIVPSAYVVATEDCRREHLGQVGGKAVGLGSLLAAGQVVPASFIVTASAYRRYLRDRDVAKNGLGVEQRRGAMADEVRHSIAQAYSALCDGREASVSVAVRSSATIEDSTEASCAGQFRTFLGARGITEIVHQVEQCWVSAFSPHVTAYRAERVVDSNEGAVAVIIQELVDARVAGVMFTQHPRTGDRSLVVIESSYGLGEAVVGGEVTPDLFEVNKITRQIHQRSCGSKPIEHRLRGDGRGVVSLPVNPERQRAWSITNEEVDALVAVGIDLESKLGRGLDVEWAIGTTESEQLSETLFSLQVRPITVDPGQHGRISVPKGSAIDIILGRLSGGGREDGQG